MPRKTLTAKLAPAQTPVPALEAEQPTEEMLAFRKGKDPEKLPRRNAIKPKPQQFTVNLPPELHKKFLAKCREQRIAMTHVVRELIEDYVEEDR
jgi:predicted HicB family RNase H-like nuclease